MQYEKNYTDFKVGNVIVPEEIMTKITELTVANFNLAQTPGDKRTKAKKDAQGGMAKNNVTMARMIQDFAGNVMARMGYNTYRNANDWLVFNSNGCEFRIQGYAGLQAYENKTSMPGAVKPIPDGENRLWCSAHENYITAEVVFDGFRPDCRRFNADGTPTFPAIFQKIWAYPRIFTDSPEDIRAWIDESAKHHLVEVAKVNAAAAKMRDLASKTEPVIKATRIYCRYDAAEDCSPENVEFSWPGSHEQGGTLGLPEVRFRQEINRAVDDKKIEVQLQGNFDLDDTETAVEFLKAFDALMVKCAKRKTMLTGVDKPAIKAWTKTCENCSRAAMCNGQWDGLKTDVPEDKKAEALVNAAKYKADCIANKRRSWYGGQV